MEPTSKAIIHEGNSIISIEVLPDYAQPVVIKKPAGSHASRAIQSLEIEYEMTRALDAVEGVRKALGRQSIDDQPALILEYIDGETLRDYIASQTLDLRSRLEMAVALTRILADIHRRNVIHLGLNSRNVLIGSSERAVRLIDLSSASRIDGDGQQIIQPDQILGELPYISPEQTGRINRAVDERSDLYSLGVVLYELMTRQLPFDSDNPAELIHHHIARIPVSPSRVSPEIPEVISEIILKLLSKHPEDRYQSAAGVLADLEKCLQGLKPDNTIEGFPVGEADHPGRIVYPQKLYDRERELKQLVDAFDSACRETSSMIFVSGYSGVGKTALVEELERPVSEKRSHFLRGKFDQYLRTTPYSGISQAFSGFVSQIMAEPEEVFTEWQGRIRSAVGGLGKVMTDAFPAVERLIGVQPGVPPLEGQEAENRFHLVFIQFLSAMAADEHPLVLFLDDLQWIDAASLRLLRAIQSDFDQPGLLVVGAYRDNEVDEAHPFMTVVGSREETGIPVLTVKLDDLQPETLETFLSDALRAQHGVEELSAALYAKTHGNPFFVRRLLSSLKEEGRFRYDPEEHRWDWNISEIKTAAIADNVADLLGKALDQLPEEIRGILTLAACIGNRFEIATLAKVSGLAEGDVIELLVAGAGGQYVFQLDGVYAFVHDQVQQAAYDLIDAESRTRKHLEIGRALLADTRETELTERIFDIVAHYNLSVHLLTDRAERLELARLNLVAGRRARLAAAFAASAAYLKQGLALLGEGAWRDHYHLTLDVHSELIQVSYLNIQHEQVEALFDTIRENAKQEADAGVAYKALIMSCVAQHELGRAISLAESYLERLDVTLASERESDLPIAELYELPQMENREKLAAMGILVAITPPMIFSAPERVPSVVYTMLNLISRYGNSSISGFAYSQYAMILCLIQQYEEGNRFGQLAVDLLEKYPHPGRAAEIMNMQCAWIRHWMQPVNDQITPLKTYHELAMQTGDIEWAFYCLLNYTLLLWGSGKPLDYYIAEVEPSIALCQSKDQQFSLQSFLMFAQSALNLTGGSSSTTQLEGKWFSEETMMSRLEGNQMLLALYGLLKMKLCYLFGDPGAAYRQTQDVLKYRGSLNPHYLYTKISFYGALACVAGPTGAEEDGERRERLERLKLFEQDLKLWADIGPMNYRHEYNLLQAEKCRVAKDHWKAVRFYELAISGAHEGGFVQEEALANELCGRFWQECGNARIAETYMREARDLYREWGAVAKVSHVENSYPQWFGTRATAEGRPDASRRSRTTAAPRVTPIQLDLQELAEASRMLSSETELDRLLAKMMELVMSYSGAERAVLLWEEGKDWIVQALSDIASGEQEILPNRSFDPTDRGTDLVPEPVFHYCRRTRELMVVGDARLEPLFAEDRVVQAHHARSMACIPALSGGELRGVLYLENSEMADVFTLERVEILNYLVSQFAVSLENVLLYESLNLKVRELQESDERYGLAVAGSEAGLWDWDIPSDQLYSSDRMKELLGLAPDGVFTLDDFWSRLHPEDHPSARGAVDKHLQERAPYNIDYRLRTESGEYRWFHARGQALWDEAGNPVRMSGSVTDIHRRKQAERALRDSEKHFRYLMEQSPLGIVILSPDGQITQVNSTWMRLWGVDELETARVAAEYNFLTDPQIEELGVLPLVEKAFAGDRVVLPPIEYSGKRAVEAMGMEDIEARTAWIQTHLYSIKDEHGAVVYVVAIHMDITDLKWAQRDAREQRDALARLDRATRMEKLTGSIAHELNQPLTGILSSAQAAEMMLKNPNVDHDPNELSEIMAAVADDAKRASEVIRGLRELYREQKGEFQPVDINGVVDETIQLLHSEVVIQNVTLTTEYDPSVRPVSGNRVQIQQVLVNLITNGIQAMAGLAKDDHQLCVATAYVENEVRVWVEDCGPGVDADQLDHIFKPLATWKPGGTGMGLAISNSIIEGHGGRMFAENRPEGGARVGFVLAVLEEDHHE